MVERKRSFNDMMMTFVAVPLVISWLGFACYVIYKGLNDDTGAVQDNLDFYVALIAIIGGPALLFINSILGAWVAEQTAEQNQQMLESKEQEYLHSDSENLSKLERKKI